MSYALKEGNIDVPRDPSSALNLKVEANFRTNSLKEKPPVDGAAKVLDSKIPPTAVMKIVGSRYNAKNQTTFISRSYHPDRINFIILSNT